MSDTLLDDWMVTFAQVRSAERARVIAAVREVLAELTQRAEDWSYHPDLRTGWATAAQRVAIKLDSLERGEAEKE